MRIESNYGVFNKVKRLSGERKSTKRLASGFRINSAADDAAGLAISEKMRAQIRGLNAAQKNVQDGVSLIQTADGALVEVHDILQRMNEMCVKAANGTYTELERKAIQNETSALLEEIERIASGTTYNDISLLDGSCAGMPDIIIEPVKASYQAKFALSSIREGSDITIAGVTFEFDSDGATHGASSVPVDISGATGTAPADYSARITALEDAITASSLSNDYLITVTDLGGGTMQLQMEAKEAVNSPALKAECQTIPPMIHIPPKVQTDSPSARIISVSDIDCSTIFSGSTITIDDIVFEFTTDGTVSHPGAIAVSFNYPLNNVADYTDFKINMRNAFRSSPLYTSTRQNITVAINNTTGIGSIVVSDTNPDVAARIGRIEINRPDTLSNPMAPTNETSVSGSEGIFVPAPEPKLTFQIGADKRDSMKLLINGMSVKDLGLSTISLLNSNDAADAISLIHKAINIVSENRSLLGVAQNRLEHTTNNLAVSSENMSASESRIRDTDMAKELLSSTRDQILLQSAQAMLAQANQQIQGVLQLLQ